MIGFLTRRRGKMTKFEELSMRDKVTLGERQIKELLAVVEDHVNAKEVDVNVVVSTMIAVIGKIIAGTAGSEVSKQDELIAFCSNAIRVSLAENGYRPVTSAMEGAIPPWEKN